MPKYFVQFVINKGINKKDESEYVIADNKAHARSMIENTFDVYEILEITEDG